jgi:hypothetical protein
MPALLSNSTDPPGTAQGAGANANTGSAPDENDWYKGFWRTDALPLGLIVLMMIAVLVYGWLSKW